MQVQANRTEAKTISSAQSLAAVQTLLRAGLGCITFMRDLLPQDNFTESHFTTTDDSYMSQSQSSSNSTFSSPANEKKNINGFKIMTMSRGYTDEADRILNHLEFGIFDALQKQYLRSFIFAIYLDNNDPNNIVEAYTFNFQYHKLAGTDVVVPVMSLSDDLRRMSLLGKDPVAEAARRGATPTLRDVKRSVKALLKTLITSMTQMDVLPKRRYATFKVFYTDDTPSDYEPPHFKAGDYEKDKWYFATHDMEEVPDTWGVGKVNAGWHEVDVSVSSIATYLPSSTEHDNQTFSGTVNRPGALVPPSLTPAEEVALRAEEIKKQTLDAENRRIIWTAEDEPKEAKNTGVVVDAKGHNFIRKPIGIRDDDGAIRGLNSMDTEEIFEERHYYGPSQVMPRGLKDIQGPVDQMSTADFPQTQLVLEDGNYGEEWQTNNSPKAMRRQESMVSDAFSLSSSLAGDSVLNTPTPCPTSRRHNNEVIPESPSSISSLTPTETRLNSRVASIEMGVSDDEVRGVATMGNRNSRDGGVDDIEDEEMLDLETQVVDAINPQLINTQTVQSPDPIQSFDLNAVSSQDRSNELVSHSVPSPTPASSLAPMSPKIHVMDCDCGMNEEDECCACEGGCEKWYHIWCMGYHSTKDPRLPEKFVCFNCRIRADPSWELIKVELYSTLIIKFRELASFRRAMKIAEKHSPLTAVKFAQAMGCENTQARQLIKRLETEGFMVEENTTTDEIGFVQSRAKTTKGKGKGKTKPRRGLQKQKFMFNRKSLRTQEYEDYFDPSLEVESRLLGIPQTRASLKARNAAMLPSPNSSQTEELFPQTQSAQSQTQDDPVETFTLKRGPEQNTEESPRRRKKVKISITGGVDLAE
ncbi:HORMA domain-containing protein [Lentinula guzmanii]|uniref:HORMA domain-containing protein n=1 Tax=Lentinula guzmanii TaxID=2804957 RepID=A0AA38JAK7_9AGAR|nr:HORMA domain-containing protein [Lentinula guzmanii]